MIKADQILSVVRNKKSSFGKKDHLSSLGNPLNNHKLYPVLRKWKHLSFNRTDLQTYHYYCIHTLSSCHTKYLQIANNTNTNKDTVQCHNSHSLSCSVSLSQPLNSVNICKFQSFSPILQIKHQGALPNCQ